MRIKKSIVLNFDLTISIPSVVYWTSTTSLISRWNLYRFLAMLIVVTRRIIRHFRSSSVFLWSDMTKLVFSFQQTFELSFVWWRGSNNFCIRFCWLLFLFTLNWILHRINIIVLVAVGAAKEIAIVVAFVVDIVITITKINNSFRRRFFCLLYPLFRTSAIHHTVRLSIASIIAIAVRMKKNIFVSMLKGLLSSFRRVYFSWSFDISTDINIIIGVILSGTLLL